METTIEPAVADIEALDVAEVSASLREVGTLKSTRGSVRPGTGERVETCYRRIEELEEASR
ncbi:MAG: hypothetical protein M0Z46_03655 [Actinomycetota bacterium]|jgi:hypothetical protein|nr:hypothetical protein [Actinomycetota bacterium]